MTGINAIIYVLSTVPTWYVVDKWGRRPILMSGAVVVHLLLFFESAAGAEFCFLDGCRANGDRLVDVYRRPSDA